MVYRYGMLLVGAVAFAIGCGDAFSSGAGGAGGTDQAGSGAASSVATNNTTGSMSTSSGPGALGQGAPCGEGMSCKSGHCVDGVCCESACDGVCYACSNGKTGEEDGRCKPVEAGTNPDDECGRSCIDGSAVAFACSGTGQCTSDAVEVCGHYVCVDGICNTECTDDLGCAEGAGCDGNACVALAEDGTSCGADAACASDNCVAGVCCNTPCTGTCRSCLGYQKANGPDGTCGPIKADSDPYDECFNDDVCNGMGDCVAPN